MSTPAPFLSRHLGDYLLVAQLSEDPLGTVFRALYAADERRFVRLRVLQSEELDAASVLLTVKENRLRDAALTHDAIVVRPELEVVDGIPFMTWDETAGWTLDTMLARVRAFGIRIPAEYALLIVERLAAALEHAHQAAATAAGRPVEHGILWPGFVSISHDATVRVGGFGIAGAILPSLAGPRMTAEIAPYVAPEVRRGGPVTSQADVYSLGAILMELMTGRRPSLDAPSAELRAGDPRSDELGMFLRRCLAEPAERFASATEMHRALQQMVTGNPFSLFTANLSLFLYKLLNPESQSVAPSSDWESTSPVVLETKTRRGESTSSGAAGTGPLRRRRGDLDQVEEAAMARAPIPEAAAPPVVAVEPDPADFAPAPLSIQEHAAVLMDAIAPEPLAAGLAPEQESGTPAEPVTQLPMSWRRPAMALAVAAGLTAAVIFLATRLDSRPRPVDPAPAAVAGNAGAPPSSPDPPPLVAPAIPDTSGHIETASNHPVAAARPARKIHPELKQPAEDLRYKAALARIEAERFDASKKASDIFGEGQQSEKEGQRFLSERDYGAAQTAYSRAAQLFAKAQEVSFQERVRDTSLSANP